MKRYVKDFIEGRVSGVDFVRRWEEAPELSDWVQTIIPPGKTWDKVIRTWDDQGRLCGVTFRRNVPFDIHDWWEERKFYGICTTGQILNIHCAMSSYYAAAFPEEPLQIDQSISEQHRFMLHFCPEYVGGREVELTGILEKLYEALPEDLSKTKKGKLFRERLKETFHLEGKKRPYWLQSPEWPLGQGEIPMRYVTSRGNMDRKIYVFEDIKTGEIREVVQFT